MKNYDEIIEKFMSLPHPHYQKGDRLFQTELDNMIKFDEYIGKPSSKLNLIHVAGTNGKGSCVNYLAAIFMQFGFKVGTYESPHIEDCRERIKINGKIISKEDVCSFWEKAQGYIQGDKKAKQINPLWHIPPYSEVYVAMAFSIFEKEKIDIAIIEVGMGGRLDPTNIIRSPLISIISSIGLDHTTLLGETLEDIALEKCGIIKSNCPIVIGNVTNNVKNVIKKESEKYNSPCYFVDEYNEEIKTSYKFLDNIHFFDLKGDYQAINIHTVLTAIDVLRQLEPQQIVANNINLEDMEFAICNMSTITGFKGRWQIMNETPYIICDICDNEFGLKMNFKQLESLMRTGVYKRLFLILGFVSCDYINFHDILPKEAHYIFTCSGGTMDATQIYNEINIEGKITNSVEEAISYYWDNKKDQDLVYIGGSVYLMPDVYNTLHRYV